MATYAPRHVDIWPWTKWYSAVGAWTRGNISSWLGMGYVLSAGNQNDEIIYNVALDAGTWTLTYIGDKASDRGIATCYLDATSLGTIDQYGTPTANVAYQIAGITVATPGVYALKLKAATKHASASAYYLAFTLVTLTRTGA